MDFLTSLASNLSFGVGCSRMEETTRMISASSIATFPRIRQKIHKRKNMMWRTQRKMSGEGRKGKKRKPNKRKKKKEGKLFNSDKEKKMRKSQSEEKKHSNSFLENRLFCP